MTRIVLTMLGLALIVLGAGRAFSQPYPNKPIRILSGSAGSNADITARLIIAQGISDLLGQPVIAENRPTSLIPEVVAKAAPDGYLIFIGGPSVWIRPLLQTTPYDPVRDFAPITLTTTSPDVLIVHPSIPVKSVKELIALAKTRPGVLNYASGTAGSSSQLSAELFKSMAGVNIQRIAYKGTAQAVTDLIGGQVHMVFNQPSEVMPHVNSGRLRALAVSTLQPTALVPGVPTVTASGLPGYESAAPFGMFAPAKTPAMAINRLNQEIVRVLNRAVLKEKFLNDGIEAVGSSPDEFATTIKAEMTKWGRVIKGAGIQAD